MLIFFNVSSKIRNINSFKTFYSFLLSVKYVLRMYLGAFRGLLIGLTGKITYEKSFRPLVLGAKTELLIRPGSALVLTSNKERAQLVNNAVFPAATSIGVRPHFNMIDPPANSTTRIELLGDSKLIIESNVMILTGSYLTASQGASISIGEGSYLSHEVKINSRASISIGKNVLIASQVFIMDYDGHSIISLASNNQRQPEIRGKPIIIENNVWIGTKVTILKGVRIGAGSIVGANSCVVSDVPPHTIVAGNPAKVVKENIIWER